MKSKRTILAISAVAVILAAGWYFLSAGHRGGSHLKPVDFYSFYSNPDVLPQKNLSGALSRMRDLIPDLLSYSPSNSRTLEPSNPRPLEPYFQTFLELANEALVQGLFVQSYLKGISERSGKEWDKKIAARAQAEERLFAKRSRKLAAKLTQLEKDISRLLPQSTIVNHVGSVPRTDFLKGLPFTLKYRLKQLAKYLDSFEAPSPVLGVLSYHSPNYGEMEFSAGEAIIPAYLGGPAKGVIPGDTEEVLGAEVTQEILDKAEELGKLPIPLYEYVKNNFSYEPYFGGMKGALETLRQGAGNDADLSSLLIALYRASGWPARYVHGQAELNFCKAANWLGLKIQGPTTLYNFKDQRRCDGMKDLVFQALSRAGIPSEPVVEGGKLVRVRVERVWVEAYVPYGNYRGAVLDNVGKSWIPLDPAMLGADRYRVEPGPLDILSEMQETGETITEAYLEAATGPTPLEFYRDRISSYLATQQPEVSYEDILAKRTLIPEPLGLLPNTLTFDVPKVIHEYAVLPEELIHRVKLTFYGSAGLPAEASAQAGEKISEYLLDLPQVAGKRLTISYIGATPEDEAVIVANGGLMTTPSYLVKVTPLIRINGVILSGSEGSRSIGLGLNHKLEVEIISPRGSEHFTYSLLAGNYYGLGLGSGRTSFKDPDSFIQCPTGDLESCNQFVILSGSEGSGSPTTISDSDSDGMGGRLLYQRVADYMNGLYNGEEEIAASLNLRLIRPASSLALIGNELEVISSLGIPQSLEWKGVKIDARSRPVAPVSLTTQQPNNRATDYMLLSGFQSSSLENKVFELGFGVESISAVKAIQLAHAQGMVVEDITGDNIGQVDDLGVSDEVKEDIINKVNQGLKITVPHDLVSYQDWLGTGYIAIDPQTKEASYLLQGNILGGMTVMAMNYWAYEIIEPLIDTSSGKKSTGPVAKLGKVGGYFQLYTVGMDHLEKYEGGSIERVDCQPLKVQALDAQNIPVTNAEITFEVAQGGGSLSGKQGLKNSAGKCITDINETTGLSSITVCSKDDGTAEVKFTSGTQTSVNPVYMIVSQGEKLTQALENQITAYAEGVYLHSPFAEYGLPGKPDHLEAIAGNGIEVPPKHYAYPIQVKVLDSYGNSISNQDVKYSAEFAYFRDNPSKPLPNPHLEGKLLSQEAYENCGITTPMLGQCSDEANEVTVKTDSGGAVVHTIVGNVDYSVYPFLAEINGVSGIGWVEFQKKTIIGNQYLCDYLIPNLMLMTSTYTDENGNNIMAGKAGGLFKLPLEVEVSILKPNYQIKYFDEVGYYCFDYDRTYEVEMIYDADVDFWLSYQEQGEVKRYRLPEQNNWLGIYYTSNFQLGSEPQINQVQVEVLAKDVEYHILNKYSGVEDILSADAGPAFGQFDIFGVKLEITNITPNPLILNGNGFSKSPLQIDYKIEPSDYSAYLSDVEIFKDKQTLLGLKAGRSGVGNVVVSKGSLFDISKEYKVMQVLNRNSEYFEIRSAEKPDEMREIKLLSFDFIDKDNLSANKLRVAKWENAFDCGTDCLKNPVLYHPILKTNFIDDDDDRFYVQVGDPNRKGEGKLKVTLSTDSEGIDYDDNPTEIELFETTAGAGVFESKSLMLVSDQVDDDVTVDGIADDVLNDRTHLITLGGKVNVEYDSTTGNQYNISNVLEYKTVNIHVVIVWEKDIYPDSIIDKVKEQWRIATERYAQVGVVINWDISVEEVPEGVTFDSNIYAVNGTCIKNTPTGSVGIDCRVNDMVKDLIHALGTSNDNSDFHVFYVKNYYVQNVPLIYLQPLYGWAYAPYFFTDSSDAGYLYNILIDIQSIYDNKIFVPGHEVGHCLGNNQHYDDNKIWNLLNQYVGRCTYCNVNNVLSPKRFNEEQARRMYEDTHTK